jgi:hypothetical protein
MRLYRGYGRMGFDKYPMFHFYCFAGYLLGAGNLDRISGYIRGLLGRSPQFGVG